jgi:predicted ATPase/DNA-binding CsgD family transcriptional regulator
MSDEISAPLDSFKPRELEILTLMAEGLTNREIADRLFITKETVRWYNKQIYSKLGTSQRSKAIALATTMGVINVTNEDSAQPTRFPLQLPVTTGPFMGRDHNMQYLMELIENPDVRLISIIGPGGMGKSRLSLEFGHQISASYAHGAVFIDLTTITSPDDISLAILEALGLTISGNQSPLDMLVNFCADKQILLIVDNFEHVLQGAGQLAELLKSAPDIAVIVTTRERLNLQVETAYYLPPIEDGAADLFAEMLSMMNPHLVLQPADYPALEHVVELVGGVPLAMVLAATWGDTLTVEEIAVEIAQNLDFLSAELADIPERQRSITAVISPTWQRLTETEQQALMYAAFFRSSFSRDLFQKITSASLRVLQTLIQRSLVSQTHTRRYDIHPLIRQFALEKLDQDTRLKQTVHQAHIDAYIDFTEQHYRLLFGGEYLRAIDAFSAELDNLRAVLDDMLSKDYISEAARLAHSLGEFWLANSHIREGRHYLTTILKQDVPEDFVSAIYYLCGRFRQRLGESTGAFSDFQTAFQIAEAQQDQQGMARGLLGLASTQDDSVTQRYELSRRALEHAEKASHKRLIAHAHNSMGIAAQHDQGNQLQAIKHFTESERLYTDIGDLRGISTVVYNLSLVYQSMDDQPAYRTAIHRSLKLKQQIGDRAGIARRLSVIATDYLLNEEFEEAIAYTQESRAICEEIGDRERLVWTIYTQGFIEYALARFESARQYFLESVETNQGLSDPNQRQRNLYLMLCLTSIQLDDLALARQYAVQNLALNTELPGPANCWISLCGYGWYLLVTNNLHDCARVSTVLQHTKRRAGIASVIEHYVLRPLLYQVEQQLGAEAFNRTQQTYAQLTLEDLFEQITAELNIR